MLKFFLKLKRRRGAVLFAVIAMMTLLIVMATTAYFTARSSYQTVVNNYTFEQTYLAAVNVSDMVVGALTHKTSLEKKSGSSVTLNSFEKLSEAVKNLAKDGVLVGYSTNIADSAKHTTEKVIFDNAAGAPVKNGVVDAVKVEIKCTNATADTKNYIITTTAYYNNNYVTVQDQVKYEFSSTPGTNETEIFKTFFTSTGQMPDGSKDYSRTVTINTHQITDDMYFESPFTAVVDNGGGENKFMGALTSAGTVYLSKISMSDIPAPKKNASNEWTERHDWIIGGDLVLTGINSDFYLNGNNLYVKGDLVILGNNGKVFSKSSSGIVGDLYICGDVYLCSGTLDTDCNWHIKGNIYTKKDANTANSDPGSVKNLKTVAANMPTSVQSSLDFTGQFNDGSSAAANLISHNSGTFDINSVKVPMSETVVGKSDGHGGYIEDKDGDLFFDKITQEKELKAFYDNKTSTSTYDTYTSKAETLANEADVDVSTIGKPLPIQDVDQWNFTNSGSFLYKKISDSPARWQVSAEIVQGPNSWDPITEATSYIIDEDPSAKSLTDIINAVDVKYRWKYGDSNAVVYEKVGGSWDTGKSVPRAGETSKTYTSAKGQDITAEKDGDTVKINIPACDEGYLLGLYGVDPGQDLEITINTPSGVDANGNAKTMPIVLKANFYQDDGYTDPDENGFNSFAWTCGYKQGNGADRKVIVKGDGCALFELGNYAKADDVSNGVTGGKYLAYKKDWDDNIATAVYYIDQKLYIGTENQMPKIVGNAQNSAVVKTMLQSGTDFCLPGYENKIMLVSNKSGGIGIDNQGAIDNLFCGYIYAPNTTFNASERSGGSLPIFGGMIVSTYLTKLDEFVFASPNPKNIQSMLGSLSKTKVGGTGGSTGMKWEQTAGKNYLG